MFCFVENTVYEVKEYIKANLFSPIKVLDFVVNTLEQHDVAIIVGYPGSGKSYIGLEVMRTMGSKDKIVLKVDEVELWNRLVNPSLGYIVFIDDFLGESNLDSAKFTKLKKVLQLNICLCEEYRNKSCFDCSEIHLRKMA